MVNISMLKDMGTRGVSRGLLVTKKYSPEILTAVGVVGGVAAAIMASRATLKLEDVVNEMHVNVQDVKEVAKLADAKEGERQKALAYAYARGTISIVKLYAPSVTLGVSSIGCVIGAHGIMRRRNVALIAAYKAIETSFSAYKQRVEDQYGEQTELGLARGITTEEIEDEKGKKKTVAKIDANGLSQYARFFDELSPQWDKTPGYNMTFLKAQQNYANDRLQARGHLFLNDVYDMLGIPRSSAGQLVGWVRGNVDDCVDFGIFNIENEKAREFVNGYESAILLDFNVDGIVYDLI